MKKFGEHEDAEVAKTLKNSNTDDNCCKIEDLKKVMAEFVVERQWSKFHRPKNLAIAISTEASELAEHFIWGDPSNDEIKSNPQKYEAIKQEMADVLAYLLSMANALDVDLSRSFLDKMILNRQKYPKEEFQGVYEKPPK